MARVLYVEDNPNWADTIKHGLERHGHTVVCAFTISDANELLSEQAFDIVICDGTVDRGGDSADLAKALVDQGKKAVILSGDRDAKREGVPYFNKGKFEMEELVVIVTGS